MAPPVQRPLFAIALRLLCTALFAVMYALAKLAVDRGASIVEILFARQAIAAVPVVIAAWAGPGLSTLAMRNARGHVTRTIAGTTGMALNFLAVAMLPLAEAQTLWFTIPLFATMLSAVWLREAVGLHRWGAVAMGFVGVLIVVQPQAGALPMGGAAVGMLSAMTVAVTLILVRRLAQDQPALAIVFWFGVLSAVPLAFALPFVASARDAATYAMLAAIGIVGGIAQIAMTNSLRYAPVAVVAPVDYSALLWSTALGAWLFGEWPTRWTWIGAPIIIGSGLYIVWREHRRATRSA